MVREVAPARPFGWASGWQELKPEDLVIARGSDCRGELRSPVVLSGGFEDDPSTGPSACSGEPQGEQIWNEGWRGWEMWNSTGDA